MSVCVSVCECVCVCVCERVSGGGREGGGHTHRCESILYPLKCSRLSLTVPITRPI